MYSAQESDNIMALRIKNVMDVRDLASHFLLPQKPQEEKDRGSPEFLRKLADASAAVEVVCSLVNVFGSAAGFVQFANDTAIFDLTFTLNTNPFWVKNSGYLAPLVNAAVNSMLDNRKLSVENSSLWSNLKYHNHSMWLELLPAIVFCLKGQVAMREVSLEIKQAFEKFLKV